jgi:hypothetical protein
MKGRCCAVVCAALRRKYVLERPAEYRTAFREAYGMTKGDKMWRAFRAQGQATVCQGKLSAHR